MRMAAQIDNTLHKKVAGFVRAYLDAGNGDDTGERQDRLRWVCVGLEWLLDRLLKGCEGWSPGFMVDGILPESVIVVSQDELAAC